jgi:RNA polymerase sigma-70 factor, ECF subfamily
LLAAMTSLAGVADGALPLPAFAEAVEMHKGMVYSIAWNFLHDGVIAEELAQDVFLQLHRNWASIQSPAHLIFWLRKVATHRAIDMSRRRKARAETSLAETDEPTVLERIHDSFLASYLNRMVASLPEKQRSVIVLRYQEDMELDEIAKTLDMKVSTVKTQISRALELLRGKVSRRLGPKSSDAGRANERYDAL